MADIKTYLNQILNAVYGKDVRQAIHDAIHQCYEDGQSGSSDLIAREGIEEIKTSIANPNLLINGDFRNPVNQRGETSYAPTGNYACYTVDRWFIFPSLNDGTGHSLTVNNGYITFANTNASMSAFMAQYLEKPLSGKFTVTVKVISTTKTLSLTYKDGGTFHTAMTLNEGVNTATIECASLDCIRVNMSSEASADIEYIKLEYGSVATPYVPRSYAEELLLCQRYYKEVLVTGLPVNYYTSDYSYVEASILLDQKMRAFCNAYFKSSDITIGFRCANDMAPSGSVDKDNIITTNQRIILKGTCTKMPISVWTKDSDILCLDAEIYN